MTEENRRITSDPGRRSGRPMVRGTRIAVSDILSMLAAGMTVEDVLADFPELERADMVAVLARLGGSEPDLSAPERRRLE